LFAVIRALTAQDAVAVFHIMDFNALPDIDTHRAVFRACFTVYAAFRCCFELKGWPAEKIPDLSPEYHKGCDPAPVMAESVAAGSYGEDEKDKKNREVGGILHGLCDGNAVFRHVQWMDFPDAAGPDQSDHDKGEPRNPDEVFDPMMPGPPLVIDPAADILETSHRAEPSAESPAQKKSGDEKDTEEQQAAGDDSFEGAAHAEVGRKIIEDDRKAQENDENNGISDFLPHRGSFLFP
jgi:hypothetical protein